MDSSSGYTDRGRAGRGRGRGRYTGGGMSQPTPTPMLEAPPLPSPEDADEDRVPPLSDPQESSEGSTTSRILIQPIGSSTFQPEYALKRLSTILKSKFDEPWTCFSEVPEQVQAMWFGEFQKEFQWEPEHDAKVKKIWHKKSAETVRVALCDLRRGKSKGKWLAPGVRAALMQRFIDDDRFKESSAINKQNIAATTLTPHRGGSVSVTEHRRRAKEKERRDVPIPELFEKFNYNPELDEWANEKAAITFEKYKRLKETRLSQGVEGMNDDDLFGEANGEINKKGRSYGFGSEVARLSQGSRAGTSSTAASASQQLQSTEELRRELREKGVEMERMDREIRNLQALVQQHILGTRPTPAETSTTPPDTQPDNVM